MPSLQHVLGELEYAVKNKCYTPAIEDALILIRNQNSKIIELKHTRKFMELELDAARRTGLGIPYPCDILGGKT